MKKYTYYYEDLKLKIEADSGREAEVKYAKLRRGPYHGRIQVTNNETGDTNVLLPIKFN